MKSIRFKALTVLSVLALSAVSANAATSSKSVATKKQSGISKILKDMSASHDSYVFGPQVTDPISAKTSGGAIGAKDPLATRNFLSLTYKINDQMSISPIMDYNFRLVEGDGQRATLNDPYLKFKVAGIEKLNFSGNKAKLDVDARYYAPVSEGSQATGQLGVLRASVNPSLKFANSKFSLAAVNYIKYYAQTKGDDDLNRFSFYTGPQVNYQVNSKITAWFLLEAADVISQGGTLKSNDATTSLVDLEPGMDIQVSDRVLLSPYLNWYTNQALKTTSVNLFASIKLL